MTGPEEAPLTPVEPEREEPEQRKPETEPRKPEMDAIVPERPFDEDGEADSVGSSEPVREEVFGAAGDAAGVTATETADLGEDRPLFAGYERLDAERPARIPNFAHLIVFLLLAVAGYLCSGIVVLAGLHAHLFGVTTLKQATNEIHYTLGSQAAWYLATLGMCAAVFPALWHRRLFDGLEWRADAAVHHRARLIGAAAVCFVLAIVDGILIPGPPDTPIDEVFRMPGAAWLLFGFGVTLAPFFEELTFRGFLLPALCTAYDWVSERVTHTPALEPEDTAHPRWSFAAMVVGSVLTSFPFALMHGEQTGYSLGPFVLLMCVSMVLCGVRLTMRSLASSVLVHACYNLLLFSLMLAGTGGFRHLERM